MTNASSLEISWTITAVSGLIFSFWLILAGWRDFSVVRKGIHRVPPLARAWGPRWWVALSAVVANGVLALIWVGFILVGIIAMRSPPPPPNVEQSVTNLIVGWTLIVMEVLLAGVQAWHLYVRGKVSDMPVFRSERVR